MIVRECFSKALCVSCCFFVEILVFDCLRVLKGLCGCVVFGEILPFDCGRFLREFARRREEVGCCVAAAFAFSLLWGRN